MAAVEAQLRVMGPRMAGCAVWQTTESFELLGMEFTFLVGLVDCSMLLLTADATGIEAPNPWACIGLLPVPYTVTAV